MTSEWVEWHKGYADGQPLARRLGVVRQFVRIGLDSCRPGSIRAISMCAGDGRDLLDVLATHDRREDVRARLVDLDPQLVRAGRERASEAGLLNVEFVCGDAGTTRAYDGVVPADIVMACGIFGNVADSDIHGMIRALPGLCAKDALVIWTRGRFEPDLTPTIRGWFRDAGFREVGFVAIDGTTMSVGAHRLQATPLPFRPDVQLFTFLPPDQRPSNLARSRERSSVGGDPPPGE